MSRDQKPGRVKVVNGSAGGLSKPQAISPAASAGMAAVERPASRTAGPALAVLYLLACLFGGAAVALWASIEGWQP